MSESIRSRPRSAGWPLRIFCYARQTSWSTCCCVPYLLMWMRRRGTSTSSSEIGRKASAAICRLREHRTVRLAVVVVQRTAE